ncbi:hypothetical protein BN2476_1290027 [Paraburkholderia piptadeniae]|uniref:Uncharacterized protein n=1 Tax=Paraburkholderia piptadeniae TaxID=1701573 RepID=A0A1N7SW70_9BURK|nr:hypothetical protein BN2476_1290027 [Paraburkholderia piptadeniae]
MPFKCVPASAPLFPFDFDRKSFERPRVEIATHHHLRLAHCESAVELRISSTGLPRFFHLRVSDNRQRAPGTEMHPRVQETIAQAARAAG